LAYIVKSWIKNRLERYFPSLFSLMQVVEEKGLPKSIKIDNGPEFTSKVLDQSAYLNGVELDFIRPGKPTDNALIEASNGRFREECLNESWFLSL
jgi:putative transposase